jgi:hypothetical protein
MPNEAVGCVLRTLLLRIIMPHYFLQHDAERFVKQIQPALGASWRRRSFEPCRALCSELAPAVRAYGNAYHVSTAGALPIAVVDGLPFDRTLWRGLVSEILLYGAAEMPEIQTAPEALARLLVSLLSPSPQGPR